MVLELTETDGAARIFQRQRIHVVDFYARQRRPKTHSLGLRESHSDASKKLSLGQRARAQINAFRRPASSGASCRQAATASTAQPVPRRPRPASAAASSGASLRQAWSVPVLAGKAAAEQQQYQSQRRALLESFASRLSWSSSSPAQVSAVVAPASRAPLATELPKNAAMAGSHGAASRNHRCCEACERHQLMSDLVLAVRQTGTLQSKRMHASLLEGLGFVTNHEPMLGQAQSPMSLSHPEFTATGLAESAPEANDAPRVRCALARSTSSRKMPKSTRRSKVRMAKDIITPLVRGEEDECSDSQSSGPASPLLKSKTASAWVQSNYPGKPPQVAVQHAGLRLRDPAYRLGGPAISELAPAASSRSASSRSETNSDLLSVDEQAIAIRTLHRISAARKVQLFWRERRQRLARQREEEQMLRLEELRTATSEFMSNQGSVYADVAWSGHARQEDDKLFQPCMQRKTPPLLPAAEPMAQRAKLPLVNTGEQEDFEMKDSDAEAVIQEWKALSGMPPMEFRSLIQPGERLSLTNSEATLSRLSSNRSSLSNQASVRLPEPVLQNVPMSSITSGDTQSEARSSEKFAAPQSDKEHSPLQEEYSERFEEDHSPVEEHSPLEEQYSFDNFEDASPKSASFSGEENPSPDSEDAPDGQHVDSSRMHGAVADLQREVMQGSPELSTLLQVETESRIHGAVADLQKEVMQGSPELSTLLQAETETSTNEAVADLQKEVMQGAPELSTLLQAETGTRIHGAVADLQKEVMQGSPELSTLLQVETETRTHGAIADLQREVMQGSPELSTLLQAETESRIHGALADLQKQVMQGSPDLSTLVQAETERRSHGAVADLQRQVRQESADLSTLLQAEAETRIHGAVADLQREVMQGSPELATLVQAETETRIHGAVADLQRKVMQGSPELSTLVQNETQTRMHDAVYDLQREVMQGSQFSRLLEAEEQNATALECKARDAAEEELEVRGESAEEHKLREAAEEASDATAEEQMPREAPDEEFKEEEATEAESLEPEAEEDASEANLVQQESTLKSVGSYSELAGDAEEDPRQDEDEDPSIQGSSAKSGATYSQIGNETDNSLQERYDNREGTLPMSSTQEAVEDTLALSTTQDAEGAASLNSHDTYSDFPEERSEQLPKADEDETPEDDDWDRLEGLSVHSGKSLEDVAAQAADVEKDLFGRYDAALPAPQTDDESDEFEDDDEESFEADYESTTAQTPENAATGKAVQPSKPTLSSHGEEGEYSELSVDELSSASASLQSLTAAERTCQELGLGSDASSPQYEQSID